MLNNRVSPRQVTQYLHPAQVEQWLAKHQEIASSFISISICSDWIVIHKSDNLEWIARLDWSGEKIIVIEPEAITSPYEFRAFNSALSFLDALLLHHLIKISETRVKSAA